MKHSAHRSLPAIDARSDQKTEFFLTASHQLKSPVAVIEWCLQSVLEMDDLSKDARELTKKALAQAEAMNALIADMLHVFRLENVHGPKTNLQPVNLGKVLEEVLAQYQTVAERKRVHLIHGPIEHVPDILADPLYLKQAVINLVDNAIKYSKPGGKVTVSIETHRGFMQLSVQDQGIGIPHSEQLRLFSEFFRGEEAKALTNEGTGLGLVLVKHIVDSLGGEVTVHSALHKGSTFTIRLPYKD